MISSDGSNEVEPNPNIRNIDGSYHKSRKYARKRGKDKKTTSSSGSTRRDSKVNTSLTNSTSQSSSVEVQVRLLCAVYMNKRLTRSLMTRQ